MIPSGFVLLIDYYGLNMMYTILSKNDIVAGNKKPSVF